MNGKIFYIREKLKDMKIGESRRVNTREMSIKQFRCNLSYISNIDFKRYKTIMVNANTLIVQRVSWSTNNF